MIARHAGACALKIELAVCLVWALVGCYGPNPAYLGLADSSVAASEDGDDSGSDEAELPRDDLAVSPDIEASETDEPDPSCGDQNPDPGEFCFVVVGLLGLPEVQSLAIADFDGDDVDDIAVTRKDDVLVLFGDGTGGFPLQADLAEPNSNYFGAAGGDLDGDQLGDLVVTQDSGDAVLVYRSLGSGEFSEPVAFAVGDQPQRVAVVDLDGDEALDLAVTLAGQDRVAVLLGDKGGGFAPAITLASGGDQPVQLGFGRFDQDPAVDLVVGNLNGKSLSVLLGVTLGEAVADSYPLAGRPRSTEVADFDLDGHLDVAAVLEDLDRAQILYGDGVGGFVDFGVQPAVGNKPMGAVTGDFNLDGAPDLVVINRDDANVGLLFGAPDQPGQFLAQVLVVGFDGFAGMTAVVAADLDDDGVEDVVVGGAGVRAMISDP